MKQEIEKNTLLAEKIAAILAEGIAVTGATAHFIETSFGRYTAETLRRILSCAENAEAETLFELLLYPDEAVQLKVETLLETTEYTDEDIKEVAAGLLRNPVQITLHIPGGSKAAFNEIVIGVPTSAINTLIERLNITRRIEPRVAEALARRLPDRSDILQARVKLRNARFAFYEPITGFLCDLIEKTHDIPKLFREAFAFMADFLDEADPRMTVYSALMEKKYTFRRMLLQARAMEKALGENPPEMLMMKGNPILCIDADHARKCMALIDRICTLIFGRTDGFIKADSEPTSTTFRVGIDQPDLHDATDKGG